MFGDINPSTPSRDLIHIWNKCYACGMKPILGTRYECRSCRLGSDSSLCLSCHLGLKTGRVMHSVDGTDVRSHHSFEEYVGKPATDYSPWHRIPEPQIKPKPVPSGFVFRPEFDCGGNSFLGSYAFAVNSWRRNETLLLTALHVLDEAAIANGINCRADNQEYSGAELPRIIKKVYLYDALATKWMFTDCGHAGSMLFLPNARAGDEEPFSHRDIAAFRLEDQGKLTTPNLAEHLPKTGDIIWLVANLGINDKTHSLPAIVVESSERTLIYRFIESGNVLPPHTSGAPLLNNDGDVVGINSGGGFFEGFNFGHANNILSIRSHLPE